MAYFDQAISLGRPGPDSPTPRGSFPNLTRRKSKTLYHFEQFQIFFIFPTLQFRLNINDGGLADLFVRCVTVLVIRGRHNVNYSQKERSKNTMCQTAFTWTTWTKSNSSAFIEEFGIFDNYI